MANPAKLTVKVKNRFSQVYDGEALAVSSVNDVGPFDVLPGHINFVSMIKKRLTIHKTDGEKKELVADDGVMIVEGDQVTVYLGVTKA